MAKYGNGATVAKEFKNQIVARWFIVPTTSQIQNQRVFHQWTCAYSVHQDVLAN